MRPPATGVRPGQLPVGRVHSVNVGGVRDVEWRDRVWRTGIFKRPVDGPIRAEGVRLDGDEQADLSVHGGPTKSVYAYPVEHYALWRDELEAEQADMLDTAGAFGENLTTEGLLESDAGVGDIYRIGDALLRVTEPRMPCSKLGLRFDDPLMTKRFQAVGRNGIYFAIEKPGEIQAGSRIFVESRHSRRLTIREVVEYVTGRDRDEDVRVRASSHPALSPSWRDRFAST